MTVGYSTGYTYGYVGAPVTATMSAGPTTGLSIIRSAGPVQLRHLALPLALGQDGFFATLAQDSTPEVLQSVKVILLTEPGERLAVPEFGTDSGAFVPVDANQVTAAIDRWDTRANPDVSIRAAGLDGVTRGRVAVAATLSDGTS